MNILQELVRPLHDDQDTRHSHWEDEEDAKSTDGYEIDVREC